MENLIVFFSNNFSNCVWLLTILIAMIPTLESKIAIPLAVNSAIWGYSALPHILAFSLSFIGSILPSYLIILLVRKAKTHASGFFVDKKISRAMFKANEIESKTNPLKKYLALACFVSVPLPLTGVWSGSVIAGLTNLKIGYAFISIAIGAFISSAIITLLCSIFNTSSMAILITSLILVIGFLIIEILYSILFSFKKNIKGN